MQFSLSIASISKHVMSFRLNQVEMLIHLPVQLDRHLHHPAAPNTLPAHAPKPLPKAQMPMLRLLLMLYRVHASVSSFHQPLPFHLHVPPKSHDAFECHQDTTASIARCMVLLFFSMRMKESIACLMGPLTPNSFPSSSHGQAFCKAQCLPHKAAESGK